MRKLVFFILVMIFIAAIYGCAGTGGLGSISRTNQLMPGMPSDQIRNAWGNPSHTQFIANKWVWKYYLHEYGKGWVPCYLVFGKETQRLEEWYASEDEYMQQQTLWLQAFPPTQRHEVYIKQKK